MGDDVTGVPPRRPRGVPVGDQYDRTGGRGAAAEPALSGYGSDRLLRRPLIEARTSLCDVLDALADHKEGLVVIGSHAVHERTRSLGIVSTTTKDCDLAVVPGLVESDPRIEDAMRSAGFVPLGELPQAPSRYEHQPGLWGKGFTDDGSPIAEVDLIVPQTMAGGGRRSPRSMASHGKVATRFSAGVDLAAVDRGLMPVESFADGSVREAYVAGPAALLCSKAYKVGERVIERDRGGRDRVAPKDGSDMWRLMAASDPVSVGGIFEALLADVTVADVARTGLGHLRALVTSGEIARLARLDLEGAVEADEVQDVHDHWTEVFLSALGTD